MPVLLDAGIVYIYGLLLKGTLRCAGVPFLYWRKQP